MNQSNQFVYPPRSQILSSWVILAITVMVLGWLLFLKFTGRQDIFSYQGIKTQTPWFSEYQSWINAINAFLEWSKTKTGSVQWSLTQGIWFLRAAYLKTKDKQLAWILSGELLKSQGIQIIEETAACVRLLSSGYTTIGLITDEYGVLISWYNQTQQKFSATIASLPSSTTKSCLQSYLDGLQGSMESLALTYKNIDGITSDYNVLLEAYRKQGGQCGSVGEVYAKIMSLYTKMQSVNAILEQVQSKLDSHRVDKYNELCRYWNIQWMTWLQQSSFQLSQSIKESVPSFQHVSNLMDYVKGLEEKVIIKSGDVNWKSSANRFFDWFQLIR